VVLHFVIELLQLDLITKAVQQNHVIKILIELSTSISVITITTVQHVLQKFVYIQLKILDVQVEN